MHVLGMHVLGVHFGHVAGRMKVPGALVVAALWAPCHPSGVSDLIGGWVERAHGLDPFAGFLHSLQGTRGKSTARKSQPASHSPQVTGRKSLAAAKYAHAAPLRRGRTHAKGGLSLRGPL